MSQLAEIATRHQTHIERLKAHEIKTFDVFLKKMLKETLGELNSGKELTEFNRRRLTKKLNTIKRAIKANFTDFKIEFDKIIMDFAEYEAAFEKRALESTVKYDFDLPSSQQIHTAVYNNPLSISGADGGSLIDGFYKNWTEKETLRIANIMNMGYAQGQTNYQIGRMLKSQGFNLTGKSMEMLVRTTMQHASNQSRQATWNANKNVVDKVRWVSTLDSRTSTVCQALDGREYPRDKGPRPPAHVGCRSTTRAVLHKDFAAFEKGGTRKAREPTFDKDGKPTKGGKVYDVSNKTTYYSWLKRQPAAVQDSIVGKTKGKLLRNGGLTAERFAAMQLDKNFKPLPLYGKDGKVGMADLEPAAFIKANIDLKDD